MVVLGSFALWFGVLVARAPHLACMTGPQEAQVAIHTTLHAATDGITASLMPQTPSTTSADSSRVDPEYQWGLLLSRLPPE